MALAATSQRFSPPTDDPYKNLAGAVLDAACLEMAGDELAVWLRGWACRLWCEVAGLQYEVFVRQALRKVAA